jgi:uncharacterized membrane protein YccC
MHNIRRALHNSTIRSASRFAVTIVVVDLIVHSLFGSTPAALLGSFAVAIHLYFLDFDGDARERFTGQGIATLFGGLAVVVGVFCAQQLWLSIAGALVVSSVFAYARVLRGYVARSAVGLQGAFFLPLMIPATFSDLPSLLGGWFIGSGVAIISALVLLPHRRTGVIRQAMAQWLRAAGDLAGAAALRQPLEPAFAQLQRSRDELLAQVTGTFTRPGAVSRPQRALSSMVASARWSMPIASELQALHPLDISTLASESQTAFVRAADLVSGKAVTGAVPNLPEQRAADLKDLQGQSNEIVRAHYPVRLMSISAMVQLFRAAQLRGIVAPVPDVGSMQDDNPVSILRANLRWNSLWLQNAVRTGCGTALSVLIVRVTGLDHGVWVILAALAVTQVTFSGVSGSRALFKIVAGAIGGVLIASLIMLFHLPYVVLVIALPVSAFIAKYLQCTNIFYAQLSYTPFALINLSVLAWPPHQGVDVLRIEDILLGATVSAGFTLLVFPRGINRLVSSLQAKAVATSRHYLRSAVAMLQAGQGEAALNREEVLTGIRSYDDALDAAFMSAREGSQVLIEHERALALSRDFLIGGDTCAELLSMARQNSQLQPIGQEISLWWEEFLSESRSD